MIKSEYKSSILIHPGVHIKNTIEEMELNQEEFAKRLGVASKTVSKIVNGKANISNDVAKRLSTMLGTSIGVWLNLQQSYDEKLLDKKVQDEIDDDYEILELLDINFFTNHLRIMEKNLKKHEKIKFLRTFLKVSTLQQLKERDLLINCRTSNCTPNDVKNIVPINAWVQTAINEGRDIQTHPYNHNLLKSCLPEIRLMTNQSPEDFLPRLTDILKESGVALAILPHLKNSKINGAVRWLSHEKVILAINVRGVYADLFWFTLFHELGHVFQHRTTNTFLNYRSADDIDTVNQTLEEEADLFSQETLIESSKYSNFITTNIFSEAAIINFAHQINIHPGIIVGRLQHDRYLEFNQFNHLKEKYKVAT